VENHMFKRDYEPQEWHP